MSLTMEDWLRIPDRPPGIPAWRLCLLMGLGFLALWAGAPVIFA